MAILHRAPLVSPPPQVIEYIKALHYATNAFTRFAYFSFLQVRQKDNILTKQVVCGNAWEGPAFVSTPPVLEFTDGL